MRIEAIMISFMLVLILTGCKAKQQVREHYVMTTDSTVVASLKEELHQRTLDVMTLRADISRMRDENTRLQSEITTHVINYDTTAKVNPDGQYPKAQEIISSSRQKLERQLQENETIIKELNREVETLSTKNINLEYELQQYKDIEGGREVEPAKKNNWWRWLLAGFLSGGIVVLLIRL